MLQQHGACRRQRDLAAAAIEERQADQFFERLDLLSHRRLREIKLFRRAAEAALCSNRAKDGEAKVLKHSAP